MINMKLLNVFTTFLGAQITFYYDYPVVVLPAERIFNFSKPEHLWTFIHKDSLWGKINGNISSNAVGDSCNAQER